MGNSFMYFLLILKTRKDAGDARTDASGIPRRAVDSLYQSASTRRAAARCALPHIECGFHAVTNALSVYGF
jgi:hypothetical protein